jgi:hypothetical protein
MPVLTKEVLDALPGNMIGLVIAEPEKPPHPVNIERGLVFGNGSRAGERNIWKSLRAPVSTAMIASQYWLLGLNYMQDNISFTTKYYRPQKRLLRRRQDNSPELLVNAIPGIDGNSWIP